MDFVYRYSLPRLRGISRSELEDIGREAFDRYLKKALFPGSLTEIEVLHGKGVRIILATSSPFEAAYPLAQFCGISASDVIATQFSYTDGVFDGKLVGVPVFSRNKCSIIRTFAERSGIDLQLCSFYTDSIHDLPLLELVGHPVAANPDPRLEKQAKKRGWEIRNFSV
jgi:HAD superfamily hydrolase (TIGR01490 family)